MLIDRAAKVARIELDRDVPKPGQRRAKDWATLIGTARKLEAQMDEEQQNSHRRIEELSLRVVELTGENADLQRKLDLLMLKDRLREIELPQKDTQFLLTGEKAA